MWSRAGGYVNTTLRNAKVIAATAQPATTTASTTATMDPSQQQQQQQPTTQPWTQVPALPHFPPWNAAQQMQMPHNNQLQAQPNQAFPAVMNSMLSWFMQAQNQSTVPLASNANTGQQSTPMQDSSIQPLPFSDDDLAQTILERTSQGMSYKSAIETLHFVSQNSPSHTDVAHCKISTMAAKHMNGKITIWRIRSISTI